MKNARFPQGGLKLVAFLLPCLLAGTLIAQDQGNGNPPSRTARISSIHGNVSFEPAGQNQWSQATLNYTLTTGDRIYTDQGADAELEVGPFTVRVGATTDLTMANLTDQLMQLGVEQGTVRVGVYELPSGNAVEIEPGGDAMPFGVLHEHAVTSAGADDDRCPVPLGRLMQRDPDFRLFKLAIPNGGATVPEGDALRSRCFGSWRLLVSG